MTDQPAGIQQVIKPQNGEANSEEKFDDQDTHTLVIQYNTKTMQNRVIFPPEIKDICTLYGMLMMGVQQLLQGQLIRDVTTGVMRGITERLAIKGKGGIKFPSPADIEASRKH
jgi:hypothetical protein